MQVQINTDTNIEGTEVLARQVETVVRGTLDRFIGQITRVEVHLSDENSGHKFGAKDKRCMLEVRLASHRPISVSDQAATVEAAVDGAAQKMKHSLDSTLGRLAER